MSISSRVERFDTCQLLGSQVFIIPGILEYPVSWKHANSVKIPPREAVFIFCDMWKQEAILGLFCLFFRKNLLVYRAYCLFITQPLWYQPMSEPSVLEPGFNNWRAMLPVFGKLSLFKHTDLNQALIFCFTAKTTKTGPTIMKKTVVSAGPWSQLSFFYFYYMESGLIFLFLSSNIWIIFSQKLGCLAAPYRF